MITSKCFRDIGTEDTDAFLLLPITRLFTERDEPAVGYGTATYSSCPSSTMFEIGRPPPPRVIPADGEPELWAPNQRSLVSREALRRRKTFSLQDCKSDTTCWFQPSPHTDQGPYSSLARTLLAAATASFNIATPLSEKKLLWVNEASRTKVSTQAMTPSTASRLMATRSKFMLNFTPRLLAPLTLSAVN